MIDRLKDLPRGGRPPQKREKAKEVILPVIGEDPRKMGYRYPVWTVPLLRHHIEMEEGIKREPDMLWRDDPLTGDKRERA